MEACSWQVIVEISYGNYEGSFSCFFCRDGENQNAKQICVYISFAKRNIFLFMQNEFVTISHLQIFFSLCKMKCKSDRISSQQQQQKKSSQRIS